MKKFLVRSLLVVLFALISLCVWVIFVLGDLRLFIPHAFQLTGFPFGSKHYVVLLQNDTELRPTGGFITAFANVKTFLGVPTEFTIQDVFTLDGYKDDIEEEAPYPMGELLKSKFYKGHNFHDANWHPDLALSTHDILEFYEKEFPNAEVDGVVTVNFRVLEELLSVVEPIQVSTGEITSNNLFHRIQYEQNNIDRHDTTQIYTRKGILSEIFSGLMKKLTISMPQYNQISRKITQALDKKDITFYFKDPQLQAAFSDYGWTNSFPEAKEGQDIFAIVEANLGGMKSDRYLERDYYHHVELTRDLDDDGHPISIATTELRFDHKGDYNPPLSHVYFGYIRAYVPKGSKLITEDEDMDIYDELGYTVFGKKIQVDPKSSFSYSFSYSLPSTVVQSGAYELYTYAQSGLSRTTYHLSFSTPTDHLLQSKEFTTREHLASFIGPIEKDKTFSVHFAEDDTPPRVSHQEFLDYNRIMVQFNEPIIESSCTDVTNYSIRDTDRVVPTLTNNPTIRFVRCEDRQATIYTRNIRTQFGEHFELELRNIRDEANNILTPNPMKITVVQRFEQDDPNYSEDDS